MIQKTSSRKKQDLTQLIIPLAALGILILFNLIRGIAIGDLGFFSITTRVNNDGNTVLAGNLISIIDDASALAIIAMGMTLTRTIGFAITRPRIPIRILAVRKPKMTA